MLADLFGPSANLNALSFGGLRLPKFPGSPLKPKKIKSLAKKYFSIPVQFRGYYPDAPDVDETEEADEGLAPEAKKVVRRKKAAKRVPGAGPPPKPPPKKTRHSKKAEVEEKEGLKAKVGPGRPVGSGKAKPPPPSVQSRSIIGMFAAARARADGAAIPPAVLAAIPPAVLAAIPPAVLAAADSV